jgi:hypothetical protein
VGIDATTPVDNVSITDSYAAECDRSFIGLQSNSRNFTITGNVTRKVTDQIIDQEPSGSGGIRNILIRGNRLERGGPAAQGGFAIALAGTGPGEDSGDAMIVANNILDGGIITGNVSRISIEHNVINGQALASNRQPVIDIRGHADNLRLIGNNINRPSNSGPGVVIHASMHGANWPINVTIARNTIRQNTDAGVILMRGTREISILDNMIHCNQPTGNTHVAISAHSVPAVADDPSTPKDETSPPGPMDGVVISQNQVRERCKSLLFADHYENAPSGAFSITENQTKGLSIGVEFRRIPLVKPRISDNLFEGTDPARFVVGPPGFTFDGSNGPQP